MQGLQGKLTPVNVVLFLIVNPPPWFGTVWAIMKTMLSTEFQKKVKMIPECQLNEYLAPGFEQFLPDDMVTGKANTEDLVRDWFTYRTFLEGDLLQVSSSSGSNHDGTVAGGDVDNDEGVQDGDPV
jgi:CRAL/TRIO domain